MTRSEKIFLGAVIAALLWLGSVVVQKQNNVDDLCYSQYAGRQGVSLCR
jgi:hypothetical protein